MASTSPAKAGRLAVTAVERMHGPIEQIVDRRVAIISGVAAPRRLVVAHVNIVSSPPGLADGIFSYQSLNPSRGRCARVG
jgi:hypothetical protein